MRRRFVMLVWTTAVLSAAAARAAGQAGDCVAITDDAARLACYDRVHGRVTTLPAQPAEAVAAPAPEPARAQAAVKTALPSRLDDRWDLHGARAGEYFVPRAYKPVYLLPATWTDAVNRRPHSPSPGHEVPGELNLRSIEAKYQISLKAKLGEHLFGTPVSLWGGYTQSSRWQVYNGAESRPFRETNYEPELIAIWPLDTHVLGWRLRMASLSLNHQSNGRALPLSRSWNRVIGELGFERGQWVVQLRPWWRVREDRETDDNPDIEDHVGRAEVILSRYSGDHAFTLQLRHSLRARERARGSAQLEWVFPLSGALHGYLQWFGGYGESLVDYNQRQSRIGLGVTIAGWQ